MASTSGIAALALTFNALTWGVSWWPFRWLEARGLHPLWATVFVYAVSVGLILLWQRRAFAELARTPSLWWLVLASGTTNAAFNSAVTMGDVVRMALLFYLMPVWAVLLARLVLGEHLGLQALLRVVLALAGAAIVLWPAQGGWPLPQSLAEWLAVLAGFSFALNNVMLRREAARSDSSRALAMFFGGMSVSALAACSLGSLGLVPWPPAADLAWVGGATALALVFLVANLALQYGTARLPANVTAVVMVSEVVFASVSAVALGAGQLTPSLVLGAALILGASLLAAWQRERALA